MGRKKNYEQRVNIIKTAYRLFVTDGYDQVTTKQIAEACGMAHSLLHYYYLTKNDLLTDVVNTIIAKLITFMGQQGVELKDRLYAYGLLNRLFYEIININHRLLGIHIPALRDGEVLRRWVKYTVDKLDLYPAKPTAEVTLAPYVMGGSMSQMLMLYADCECEMEIRELVNLALDGFYTLNGMTRPWIQATLGLIDQRMTLPFVRVFLAEFDHMMRG